MNRSIWIGGSRSKPLNMSLWIKASEQEHLYSVTFHNFIRKKIEKWPSINRSLWIRDSDNALDRARHWRSSMSSTTCDSLLFYNSVNRFEDGQASWLAEPIRSSSVKLTKKVKGEWEASNSHSKTLYARTSRIKSAPAVRSQFRYSPLGQTKKENFLFSKSLATSSTSSPGERLTGESIESVRLRCPEPRPGWIWLGKTLFTLC